MCAEAADQLYSLGMPGPVDARLWPYRPRSDKLKIALAGSRTSISEADLMPALTRLESELRALARERIREGRLPDRAPARAWGGPGSGRPCAVCGDVVPASEMEYEADAILGDRLHTLHFHFVCHAAWQLECVRVGYTSRAQESGRNAKDAPRGLPVPKPPKADRSVIGVGHRFPLVCTG